MNDYRLELIKILKDKVEEGLTVVSKMTVADKDYASAIMNILNSDKTAEELQAQLNFDKAMSEKDAAEKEAVEGILEKQEEFEIGGNE